MNDQFQEKRPMETEKNVEPATKSVEELWKEKICKMQEAKQELAESVIQAGDVDGAIMRMSGEQLMEILE